MIPDEEDGEEWDEKSVGVVGDFVPVLEELECDTIVDGDEGKGDERNRYPIAGFERTGPFCMRRWF